MNKQQAINDLKKLLEAKGIKPSYQRLRILEYIAKQDIHPSVDIIYKALSKKIPTLSKTTVYNTLSLFEKKRLVTTVTSLDNELRYDYRREPHAHFLCTHCGKVFDVSLETDLLYTADIQGHRAGETHIHFKGTCKNCIKINNPIEKS